MTVFSSRTSSGPGNSTDAPAGGSPNAPECRRGESTGTQRWPRRGAPARLDGAVSAPPAGELAHGLRGGRRRRGRPRERPQGQARGLAVQAPGSTATTVPAPERTPACTSRETDASGAEHGERGSRAQAGRGSRTAPTPVAIAATDQGGDPEAARPCGSGRSSPPGRRCGRRTSRGTSSGAPGRPSSERRVVPSRSVPASSAGAATSHSVRRPLVQCGQRPQEGSHESTTWSPGSTEAMLGPTRSTTPAPS